MTQTHLRGILLTLTSFAISLGNLLQFLLGSFLPWRQAVLINAALPLISSIAFCFIPETPIWLLTKKRNDEAKKNLAWLRGWTTLEKVDEEFQEIVDHVNSESVNICLTNTVKFPAFLLKKEVYWPLGLIAFTFVLVFFCGTSTLTIYAVPFFAATKTPFNAFYVTVFMGISQLVGGLFCVAFIKFGKRLVSFITLIGTGMCMLITAIYLYYHRIFSLNYDQTLDEKHWVPLVFILIGTFISFSGYMHLPWILIGEVYPEKYRASASGISSAVGYFIGFVSNKLFLRMVLLITLPGVLLLYSIITLLGFVCLYFVLPETERKPLEEVVSHFRGKGKLDNTIKRFRHESKDNR